MNDLDPARRHSCRGSQSRNSGRVEFNRENMGSATCKRHRKRARACTYIDDEFAWLDADLGDESVCEVRS